MANDELKLTGGAMAVIWIMALLVIGGGIFLGCWGCPRYHVWQQGLVGEAELRRAEQNRKITVQEAEAKLEAAKSLAEAEVERAKGVAKANEIIGGSLNGREEYLHYLWIHAIQETQNKVIYIPTEANLPVLEAMRLRLDEEPPPKPSGEKKAEAERFDTERK
jgi:hypothetical protein